MQAVVLAGGLGTRLRPLTERVPKPMVDVAGRPFLEYILRHLAGQGFQQILILVGYLGQVVADHFGDGSKLGITLDYAWEHEPLGTAGAIRNALSKIDDRFLLVYGDSFLPIDYRPLAQEFTGRSHLGVMVVYDNRFGDTGVINNVAVSSEGDVLRYAKCCPAEDLQYVEAGVLCLRREAFENLPLGEFVALEKDIYSQLIAQRQLGTYIVHQRFFDIGTPERLKEFAVSLS